MLVHDINENINKTLNKIFSYINSNLNLKKDFDDYCKAVGISKDNKNFNSYALNYIFERRLGENKKSIFDFAIESASDLSQEDINVINCLKNSIDGVFEVRKITKDKFELFNITNEKMYLAKPMAKMTKFSNLSIGHFIIAKLIIIENEYYIYHVVDHITYSNRVLAFQIAVTRLVQDPSLYYYDNEQKLEELKLSARILDVKFTNMFNSNYAVTSNKSVDILIAYLNEYIEKNIKPDDEIISSYIDPYKDNEYFEVSSLKGQGNVFAQAKRGFSSQKEKYNVALLADEKTGLQVVPFMDIFLDIFERDDYKSIKKYKECMSYFITSRQVPPLALEIAYNKFQDKFLLRVNEILGTQFTSIEEIFSKYKQFYLDNPYTTSTLTLYSSYAFIKLLEVTDEEENPKQVQKVGRNDLCPCGSGLKYKKCCGKTIQI